MTQFIKISYTGKLKDNGKIFDTTSEKVAKEAGIFNKDKKYHSLPLMIGAEMLIPGLEEALKSMKLTPGEEKKKIEISPEKAFGKRDPSKIKLVSRGKFKKEGINPIPGMPVELDGKPARIQTVAGGRVRVDFNSELAGRTIIYNLKIEAIAKTKKEKVTYLVERSFDTSENFKVSLDKTGVRINLPQMVFQLRDLLFRKASLAGELFKCLKMKEVIFEENWKKPEEKKSKK